jgi:ClpX C4-type zinc finger
MVEPAADWRISAKVWFDWRAAHWHTRTMTMKDFHCSFCNRARTEVPKLISGPFVFLCSDCLESCEALVAQTPPVTEFRPCGPAAPPGMAGSAARRGRCSFCSRTEQQTGAIVHGYVAAICDGCLKVSRDIVTKEAQL